MLPTISNSRDHMAIGCAMGCGCQIGFFLLAMLARYIVGANAASNFILMSWGVTQWIALIPLILHQRSKGYPKNVRGLLISGFLGLLLSSACAAMLFNIK